MVWKVSPAERQVRKIASRIGLDDSELLSTVFEKMQQEYVVAEWQLPVLDSRQWEQLCCPIGLAVAVRYLSPLESSSSSLLLPDRQEDSVGTNIKERELNISVESATIMEQVGKEDIGDEVQGEKIAQCRNDLTSNCTGKRNETEKFDCKVQTSDLKETKRSLVLSDYALKKEITLPLEKKCTSIGIQNNLIPLSVVSSSSESSEDISHAKVVPFLSSSTEEEEEHADDDETYNYLLGSLSGDDASNSDTLFSMQDDDVTVVVSNVSSACKTAASKRKTEIKNYGHSFKETSTYETETAELQLILLNLPDDDHRAILSQLMIMANARDGVSRINIALQVKNSLLNIVERNGIKVNTDEAVKLITHLARLRKPYRSLFSKSLFKALSRLFKRTNEQGKNGKCDNSV